VVLLPVQPAPEPGAAVFDPLARAMAAATSGDSRP
jgi:hypothetical protein